MTLDLRQSPKERSSRSPENPRAISLPPTGSGPRDYIRIADAYAREAIADRKGRKFGKWFRLAAARYVNDRKRANSRGAPFTFDEWHARDACDFIEKLPHVEGKWETPTIVLHPAHVFFVVSLFGFRNRDGGRRFTSALFAIARKNAKSTLSAAVLLYCLCCEPETGPQVITAATTGDQARIVFNIAKRMVELTSDLREAFTVEAFANAIARFEVGGTFKPINAKASTQDGLNPSHVALDEIHAHKAHDLLNVLQSAAGARANPLFLFTTTEGYENPGPWPELRHFAKQVLQEVLEADHFLAVYFAVDDEEGKKGERGYRPADDDFDESTWRKANPLLDVNPHLLKAIQKEALEAKAMPGRHAEFKIKRLNRPSASQSSWIDLQRWRKCAGAVDLEWLRGKPCTGGLDLASTRDLCSFRLVWHIGDMYYTWGRRWVPKWAVAQRTERGAVPYAAWVASGHLTQTEGDVVDYAIVERDVIDAFNTFQPTAIGYDRWNATDICNRLTVAELPMVEFIQGPKSYHPAMQEFERAYIAGNFRHGGDPVLTWCASNLVARTDANMNTAPDKKRSPEKIDDMVALLMAVGVGLSADPTGVSFWEAVAA
jgi:phage terminase large subunit-like protein